MSTEKSYQYDAFISHAVEDKIPIANELSIQLEKAGLKIWYSGRELNTGDNIQETIHEGLNQSRYGIVIFSKNYLSKVWTLREFYTLLARAQDGSKVILPVLFDVTPADLAAKDLTMADLFAINAAKGIEYVANRLLYEINRNNAKNIIQKAEAISERKERREKRAWFITMWVMVILIGIYAFITFYTVGPGTEIIEQSVQNRITNFQEKIDQEHKQIIRLQKGNQTNTEYLQSDFNDFKNVKSYYRNEYTLNNDFQTIRFKKNVESVMNLDLETLTPGNNYRFVDPAMYIVSNDGVDGVKKIQYIIMNMQGVTYSVGAVKEIEENTYRVSVTYTNPIRSIMVTLTWPNANGIKKHDMDILALLPEEKYIFQKQGDEWALKRIE